MMRISCAMVAALLSATAGAAAAPCFLPTEIDADQAIRLRTSLLVVSLECKDPTYTRFLERNGDTLAAYDGLLFERFERDRSPDGLANYLTQLESVEKARAERTPSYCADAFELVALADGMRPDELRSYAAAQAEAARETYAICTDLGNPRPALMPVSITPLQPPSAQKPAAATIPAIPPAAAAALPVPPPRESAEEEVIADLVGNEFARMLDPVARQRLREVMQQTLETAVSGHANVWRNGQIAGTVVASPAFKNPAGQWCRKLVHIVTVGRQTHSGNGTACRSDEGRWDLVH